MATDLMSKSPTKAETAVGSSSEVEIDWARLNGHLANLIEQHTTDSRIADSAQRGWRPPDRTRDAGYGEREIAPGMFLISISESHIKVADILVEKLCTRIRDLTDADKRVIIDMKGVNTVDAHAMISLVCADSAGRKVFQAPDEGGKIIDQVNPRALFVYADQSPVEVALKHLHMDKIVTSVSSIERALNGFGPRATQTRHA